MVTIQEVIASTGLPPDGMQRLFRVMQQYGYAEGETLGLEVQLMMRDLHSHREEWVGHLTACSCTRKPEWCCWLATGQLLQRRHCLQYRTGCKLPGLWAPRRLQRKHSVR